MDIHTITISHLRRWNLGSYEHREVAIELSGRVDAGESYLEVARALRAQAEQLVEGPGTLAPVESPSAPPALGEGVAPEEPAADPFAVAPKPEAKKRGRVKPPPAGGEGDDAADPFAAAVAAEPAPPTAADPPAAATAAALKQADVIAAASAYVKSHGPSALRAKLDAFGVVQTLQVPQERWAEFVASLAP